MEEKQGVMNFRRLSLTATGVFVMVIFVFSQVQVAAEPITNKSQTGVRQNGDTGLEGPQISLSVGYPKTLGDLSAITVGFVSVGLSGEIPLIPNLSITGSFHYNRFSSNIEATISGLIDWEGETDFHLNDFFIGLGPKIRVLPLTRQGDLSPWVGAEAGIDILSGDVGSGVLEGEIGSIDIDIEWDDADFSDTAFGFHAGGGVDYVISERFFIGGEIDYHGIAEDVYLHFISFRALGGIKF